MSQAVQVRLQFTIQDGQWDLSHLQEFQLKDKNITSFYPIRQLAVPSLSDFISL